MKRKIFALALFSIIALSGSTIIATPVVSVSSCDNSNFKNKTDQFSPQQKIYVHVILEGLESGNHTLTLDWVDPEGNVQSQSNHNFTVHELGYYQQMFSLKLLRLGMFTQMFEGSSYPRNFLGKWSCRVLLDGRLVKEHSFTVS